MGEWRFLSPVFLLGALSVAVPIVLHLFRRRNDPVVPFSALRFLQAAPIEQARRRRLQDLLLLALRVAALLLLALGFARHYLQTPADASGVGVRVIALDTSKSMLATDVAPNRLARAKLAIQDLLTELGGDFQGHGWLLRPLSFFFVATVIVVWMSVPFVAFTVYAALTQLPTELLEAAEIDGAGVWGRLRYVVLPSIRPVLSLSVILAISGSLSVFEIPYIMTDGATGTSTFVIQTVKFAFQFNKTGLASACAVVLLAIILLITWIQRRLVPDEKVDLV